jgi:hypothetical protein
MPPEPDTLPWRECCARRKDLVGEVGGKACVSDVLEWVATYTCDSDTAVEGSSEQQQGKPCRNDLSDQSDMAAGRNNADWRRTTLQIRREI